MFGLTLTGPRGIKGDQGIPGALGPDGAPGPGGIKGVNGEPNYYGYGRPGTVGQKVLMTEVFVTDAEYNLVRKQKCL